MKGKQSSRDIVKSHKKRWLNIKKKSCELSTLCDVDVCLISVSADKKEIDTWPEDPQQLKPILRRYKQHKSKFNSQFRQLPFTASNTADNIVPLLSRLSSDSLKIFSNKLASKIEKISNRIEELKDHQTLQPSMFFTDRIDCSLDQSNPNLGSNNNWMSFSINDPYLMPLPEAIVFPAAYPEEVENQLNNEILDLYSDSMDQTETMISLLDPYLPNMMQEDVLLNINEPPMLHVSEEGYKVNILSNYDPKALPMFGEKGYQVNSLNNYDPKASPKFRERYDQFNNRLFHENVSSTTFQEVPSNSIQEYNYMPEIPNRDDDTFVLHGESLISSDEIQFARVESSQFSSLEDVLCFF